VKSRTIKWFREHRVLRVLLPSIVALLLAVAMVVPSALATSPIDVTGAYTVTGNISIKYLDGSSHPKMPSDAVLTITTQSGQVISAATLTTSGETVPLEGLVGTGSRPSIVLKSTSSAVDTFITINGRVSSSRGGTRISGRITGYIASEGYKWDLSDTGTAATYTGAEAYGGSGYCTLLTAGAGAGAECIQLNFPDNKFKLSDMTDLAASTRDGISFYYKLESGKANGPYIGLRFSPWWNTVTDLFASVPHVDVTIGELYSATGDGEWTKYTVTSASTRIYYYGNDPVNFTSFGHPGDYLATLDLAEDSINTNAAMTAHGANASDWVLTAVYIDLYEAGERTCYIDNVQIGRYTYTLEPLQIDTSFRAEK
jgi:hypothetical protein